ncbi:hypothetical protein Tco_0310177, partial [Tanacetum coccineum]
MCGPFVVAGAKKSRGMNPLGAFPDIHSRRHVAGDSLPRRHVAGETRLMSPGKEANVVVNFSN